MSGLEIIQLNLLSLKERKLRLGEQKSLARAQAAEPGLTARALVSEE